METVEPGHERYDDLRKVFNAAIDKRPGVIARCADAQDVREALDLASRRGLEVAVRSGGHSVSGLSTTEGGLMVDVRPMNTVVIDPDRRTARVGAGATWGEFDAAAQEHGLVVTGGRATTTGVAGYTLGGGDGWLARAFGLACDNLVSVDLVTADGREVTASEAENPELFWALHGGGGNFGVATSFEFRLPQARSHGPTVPRSHGPTVPRSHGPTVPRSHGPTGLAGLAGLATWPGDRAREIAIAFRDFAASSPEVFGSGLLIMTPGEEDFVPPHMKNRTAVGVALIWAGDVAEGREAIRPLMDLEPHIDLVDAMAYTEFQEMLTDPPGHRHYWSADFHDSFPDPAIDVFVESGLDRGTEMTQQILFPWGGAIACVPEDATPIAHRATPWVTHPFAIWDDPEDDGAAIAWARKFRRDIAAHTSGGVWLNYIGNEGQDRVRAAFGEAKYARLSAVKAEYDPQNVFRGNQNIRPAA